MWFNSMLCGTQGQYGKLNLPAMLARKILSSLCRPGSLFTHYTVYSKKLVIPKIAVKSGHRSKGLVQNPKRKFYEKIY